METNEGENIGSLASFVCKDALELRSFKDKCEEFLTKVCVPAGWDGSTYKLCQGQPTYKYRKKLLTNFIDEQKSKGITVKGTKSETSITTKEFFEQLKQFSELAEPKDSFSEFSNSGSPDLIDLFEKNFKLRGVVVRKSDTKFKASILIRREGRHGNLPLSEYIIDVHNESEGGCRFKVGDIVEVTKCTRKQGEVLEPEVIK